MRSRLAALALVALALAGAASGCSSSEIGEGATVRVYVSVPLRGGSGGDGLDVVRGARLALADADEQAGELRVELVIRGDTQGSPARWSAGRVAANARRAIEDSSAIAYIGDFESGATRTSLPITNEASLLQVSPASAAVDLTRQFVGAGDDVPEDVQPSGDRTFARVIPSDEAQGAAAGRWARALGARHVAIVRDGSDFGRALGVGFAAGYGRPLSRPARADAVYLAGEGPAAGIPDAGTVIGSDALLACRRCADAPSGLVLATSAAQDPRQLPAAGQDFVEEFSARYHEPPGRYAAYGYEAMAAVLDAVERAGDEGTDRQAVIDAFFGIEERRSVLGTYSIDEVGDTTLTRMSGYQVDDDRATYEGALPDR